MSLAGRALLEEVVDIARAAAREILTIYAAGEAAAAAKADDSPLTAADLAAHRLIERSLHELTPDIPLLSEEGERIPFARRGRWAQHWLIDPLDGTREFLARNGQFTVNIALIEAHAPVLGVVHVPVTDTSYRGLPGRGAWRQSGGGKLEEIRVSGRSAASVRVAGSRSHRGTSLQGFLGRLGAHELLAIGSALKFCLVAEGSADVYPRLGPTSEWDTAAAHAVVEGAGGTVVQLDGAPLRYNHDDSLINPAFVVWGPADRDWLALLR